MVRQLMPEQTLFIDSLYYKNSDSLEMKVEELESRQIAIQVASEAVKQKKEEAEKADKELRQLKKGNRMK